MSIETLGRNHLFDDISVGQTAEIRRRVNETDLIVFAHASGNRNPLTLPDSDGDGDGQPEAVVPNAWAASLFSAVFGMILPGAGSELLAQEISFLAHAQVGDTLTVRVEVTAKDAPSHVFFALSLINGAGETLATGTATVKPPSVRMERPTSDLPGLLVSGHALFDRLMAACEDLPPMRTAIVCPEKADPMAAAIAATKAGLIEPVLIGNRQRIEQAAAEVDVTLEGREVIDTGDDPHDAAVCAARMAGAGEVQAISKGHLHTDELLSAVLDRSHGLRTGRRLSHVFVLEVPGRDSLTLISDAAINIAPDLQTKVDITQNAIDLAHALGMPEPKVGILSAVETVVPAIPSTLDAAVLSKMADRGQIKGGLVDGPLAIDNAVDVEAARTKGIRSLVAGRADVLICPNLEAGNMLAKELIYIAHANAAGLCMGAKVPIMLTSRADDARARIISCALAVLSQHYKETGTSRVTALAEASEAVHKEAAQ